EESFFLGGPGLEHLPVPDRARPALLKVNDRFEVRVDQVAMFAPSVAAVDFHPGVTSVDAAVPVDGDAPQSLVLLVGVPREGIEDGLAVVAEDEVVAVLVDRVEAAPELIERYALASCIDACHAAHARELVVEGDGAEIEPAVLRMDRHDNRVAKRLRL